MNNKQDISLLYNTFTEDKHNKAQGNTPTLASAALIYTMQRLNTGIIIHGHP